MTDTPTLNWLDKLILAVAKGWGIHPAMIHVERVMLGLFFAVNTSAFIGLVVRPEWPPGIVRQLPPSGMGSAFAVLVVLCTIPMYLFTRPAEVLGTKDIAGWERAGYLALFFFLTVGLYVCIFALSLWLQPLSPTG